MFMEDVIKKLADAEYVFTGRDRKFIRSIGRQVEKDQALTTRQGWALLAIMRNNPVYAEVGLQKSTYDALVAKPIWRTPLVPSVELRSEVRHLGDNVLGFRTSNGAKTEIEFSAMGSVYSQGMRIVVVHNRASLNAVIDFIGAHDFEMDTATERYLADCLANAELPTQVILEGSILLIDAYNDLAFSQFAQRVLGGEVL